MADNVHFIQSQKDREERFNVIFQKLQPGFCNWASRFVKNLEVAEDIVNDSFANYWEKGYTLDNLNEANALLLTMVRNGCLYYLRTPAAKKTTLTDFDNEINHSLIPIDNHAAEFLEITQELRKRVESALKTMPAQQSQVFKLTYLKGLKRDEVAEKLKISSNTVRNHNAAALKYLRKIFTNRELMIILLLLNIIDN